MTGRYPMTAVAADLDGDGWLDIYVASDSTAAILYRNNRDGTFSDVALESGAAYNDQGSPQAGMGLAVGDVDADGRLDLLKTHFADDIPALYHGLGKGLFEDVAMLAGLGVQNRHVEWGAGLPDLDNDGWPDILYVTGNVYPEVERPAAAIPASRAAHRLSQHRRPAVRRRVGDAAAPGAATPRSSRGAAFGDVDNDGDVDVLVMNMNEPPSLLRNDYGGPNGWITIQLEGREVESRRPRRHRAGDGRRADAGAGRPQPGQLLLTQRRAAALRARRARLRRPDRGPVAERRRSMCCATCRGDGS